MAAIAAAALTALAGPAPEAVAKEHPEGRVVIAVLPYGEEVKRIGAVPGIAPGIVSGGLGSAPPAQSFLDIGQGNRVNERLYEGSLLPLYVRNGKLEPGKWDEIRERAADAPADVVPGLLASTLEAAGYEVTTETADGLAPLIAADRDGEIVVTPERRCPADCPPGLTVVRVEPRQLEDLAASLGPDDLLIAFAAGSRTEQPLWPAGIVGEGFEGNLTSDSTRTDGIVLATDIAPTVLDWLGVEVPSEMNGKPIRAEGDPDPAEIADLQEKLRERPSRDTVALLPLAVWLLVATLLAIALRGAVARAAFRVFGLACAWAPFILLVAAAIDASEPAAALMMGLGALALAGLTERFLPGPAGLALACGVTVGSHAIDVVAGSPYTALSVLGPNPGGGVRFFGIGNELEAILTTLTLIGAGAWLSTSPGLTGRAAAGWFLAIAGVATLAFAPGRFGADVGAAIVLGIGGATAAVLAAGVERKRAVLYVVGGGALALAALVLIDLVVGGAHLSNSVLGAGEAGDVADVFERRIRLMVNTFIHPIYPELLIASAIFLIVGFVRGRTVVAWFGDAWAGRCGFLGAVTGVLLGTLANDSGSVLLVLGTIFLGAGAAFWWGDRR